MIHSRRDYGIRCDKCGESLETPMDDPILIAHRGHSIYEGTVEHIKEVAENYGWEITENIHFCKECR